MGFFDFLKKKSVQKEKTDLEKPSSENLLKVLEIIAKPDDDLDHLTKDGELPWGWHSHNKAFTDKINTEYSYFLNMWLDARNKTPKEQYQALKSFVLYLDDAGELCKSKGECFEFWFYEILTSKDYIEKRKKELTVLINNFDRLQEIHEKLDKLKPAVVILLKENDGILQSEFKKLFDAPFQSAVSDILYEMSKSGELERIKSGKSYILHYKE